ncbi:hypothetical protein VMUT_0993 [Vulcanisaeta moutnovskia 768-28]|uniref:Uncharacterized protein n=1 Tax=Vulcanisaeta moutnovskia (strain 768-28) TaxID=985053 RepID=F0QXG2_VULM7|nr:hypothetical protein [Vulcanisaeta moutnovskia]ADY01201.1 hypothetical protein VMUT_0993 [Vulcanisaeta moutnovskia 768-28]
MGSDEEEFMRVKEYVDRRLEEFRDELLDFLSTTKSRDMDKVRRELIKFLVREIEELRSELLSEVRGANDLGRRLDELGREVEEIRQLVDKQGLNDIVNRVKHELNLVEARLRWFVVDKVNEIELRRRRNGVRRAIVFLFGTVVVVAIGLVVAIKLAPWLIPLIIIAVYALLRRW